MIELRRNDSKAVIDTHGAWLINLVNDTGDILFPKRTFELPGGAVKARGGCHVCLPNFGPGGESNQPQHGFGREVVWEAEDVGDNYALLGLKEAPGEYMPLSATLSYVLEDTELTMILELANNSQDRILRVGPAFHPYFSVLEGTRAVKVDGQALLLNDLSETVFTEGAKKQLTLPHRKLTLTSENLPTWAQWTDRLGSYVCVEPTLGGYTFLNDTPQPAELLQPGETKKYSLTIDWGERG